MYHCDVEAALEIVLVNLLKRFEDLGDSSVWEVVDRCKTDFVTQCQEKWNLVDKKDVGCQKNLLVELQELHRDFHIVPSHQIGFVTSGLAFQ